MPDVWQSPSLGVIDTKPSGIAPACTEFNLMEKKDQKIIVTQ